MPGGRRLDKMAFAGVPAFRIHVWLRVCLAFTAVLGVQCAFVPCLQAQESQSEPQLNGRVDMLDNVNQAPAPRMRLNRKAIVPANDGSKGENQPQQIPDYYDPPSQDNQNRQQTDRTAEQKSAEQTVYKNEKGEKVKGKLPADFLSGNVSIGDQFPDMASQKPALGSFNQAQSATPPAPPARSPYIWQMSRDGGYYDASGQIKGTVPGSELWRYGGVMGDEVTPVPQGPVRMNSAGHIRWQPSWMSK